MKYKLINTTTKEEHLCDKVTIDGFEYYVSDGEIKLNDPITDKYRVWFWRDDCSLLGRKKVIATNNPNTDIPKVVDEMVDGKGIKELAKFSFYEETQIEDFNSLKGKLHFLGFAKGYNKSQETHPFSEDDMIEFAKWSNRKEDKSKKELLQLWKDQQSKTVYYE